MRLQEREEEEKGKMVADFKDKVHMLQISDPVSQDA